MLGLLASTAASAAAQSASVSASAGVERTLSFDVGYQNPAAPGCSGTTSDASLAERTVACTGVAGVTGRAFGSASTSGVFRASASLDASALTLGTGTGGVLSAVGRADLSDVVSITSLSARTPTSFTLFVDWDGDYRTPTGLPTGVTPYASGFLGFFAAGFQPQERGWSGWTRSTSAFAPDAPMSTVGNGRYAGIATRVGEPGALVTTIAGRSSFVNIPFSSSTFTFNLSLVAEVMLQNLGGAPVNVAGLLGSDFSQTATVSGFQVFDAAGQDMTAESQVVFRSGFAVPLGAPTTVPEPATVVLVAAGLAGVGMIARRRRAA
jgi:hypothetical protein